jgi:hypothetical protein
MAKFNMVLPDDIMADFKKVYDNSEKIFGEMTKAGAEVVMRNVIANVPDGIRKSPMMGCLKMTDVYKTPSDDGINTKVAFYGYFTNENGKKTPAPLVGNVFEYGRSNLPFPKQPFMRRSFNAGQITAAMKKAQVTASGGLLKDE